MRPEQKDVSGVWSEVVEMVVFEYVIVAGPVFDNLIAVTTVIIPSGTDYRVVLD